LQDIPVKFFPQGEKWARAVPPIADPDAIRRNIRNRETAPSAKSDYRAPTKSNCLRDISSPFKRRWNDRESVMPHFEKASEPGGC
jgi:hypothetical protein